MCALVVSTGAGVRQAESARVAAKGEYSANDALVRGSTVETDPGVQAARAKPELAAFIEECRSGGTT